jgi:hypothetical protein
MVEQSAEGCGDLPGLGERMRVESYGCRGSLELEM